MTVREHFDLFCGIKCVPLEIRERTIMHKMKEMDLLRYKDIISMSLSGGNKRKLSTALATLGILFKYFKY